MGTDTTTQMPALPPLTEATVAVFGLGEAGSAIAADLAAAGATVRGYDPAPVPEVAGVLRVGDPIEAVVDADVVLAITAAADAPMALGQARREIPAAAVYADLSTAAPDVKQALAANAAGRDLAFVDVALMSTVPGRGLHTPALASGVAADRYAGWLASVGVPIEAIGPRAGDAATRKLLRSIVMKGLAGVLIEAMRAADAAGLAADTWSDLAGAFDTMDAAFARRLVEGTAPHAVRRLHEMKAAQALVVGLGLEAPMTSATVESLRAVPAIGIPPLPDPPGRSR
jgi:3-hydroxyisobutyrate dehydrogenase-like beta-hydroxyacid dehydrogenase